MTIKALSSIELLFAHPGNRDIFSRIWSIANSADKSLKRSDYRDANIEEAVKSLLAYPGSVSLRVGGPMLLGLARIYAKKIESFESKLASAVQHIEAIFQSAYGESTAMVPMTSVKSARKRVAPSTHTPLQAVPEDDAIMFQSEIHFDFPQHPMLSTPVSSRKRLYVTPRSISLMPLEEMNAFEATPRGRDSVEDSAKRRRMSSVSEVMDSLRADDGQRRLSGLIGTGNGEVPPSPLHDDHFDLGIEPPSPWTLDTPEPTAAPRRVPRPKSLMDKRGKAGIEIAQSKVDQRRTWYLNSVYYLSQKRIDLLVHFSKEQVVKDLTSHVVWYRPPAVPKRKPPTVPESFIDGIDNEYPDYALPEDSFTTPCPPVRKVAHTSMLDRLAGLEVSGTASVVDLIAGSQGRVSKQRAVANFIDLLSLASKGVVTIHKPTGPLLSGSDSRLISKKASSIIN